MLISLERVSGIYAWNLTADFDVSRAHSKLSGTMANLLIANTSTNSPDSIVNPFSAPRVAADAVLPLEITVGGSFGYLSVAGQREDRAQGPTTTTQFPTGHMIVAAARVGWAHALTPWLAVWPRAGFSYANLWDNGPDGHSSAHYLNLALEPDVMFTVLPHVAILLGATLDFPLGGAGDAFANGRSDTYSTTLANYGGSAGVAVYF